MRDLKELTVFAEGDATKISTWSNVPFLFTATLEKKGIKVNRVDISPNYIVEKVFNKSLGLLLNLIFNGNNTYSYFRSSFHFFDARRRIKRAINKFPRSDAYIFLTFSFSAVNLTQKPVIQFCDWTYDHYFKYFQARKPNFFESQSIKREEQQINGSDLVIPLFPCVAGYMTEKYNSTVVYLGNVINSVNKSPKDEILHAKIQSEKILFIGSPKYIEGAKALIQAFVLLKKRHPSMSLHFIGLHESHFKQLPEDVYCYGYLDKADNKQRDTYYQLLKEAKVFVNTTPKWSAFSASIEAMYFYTPVIVPSYEDFTKTFGTSFNGGIFCNDNSLLAKTIETIFEDKSYRKICANAKRLVENFTWDSFIDKLLVRIRELSPI